MTKLVEEDVTPREDMAWTKLIESPSGAVIVTVDDTPKESPSSLEPIGERKSSFFGSLHKQFRMSLKAVSDSPGPMTRYAK